MQIKPTFAHSKRTLWRTRKMRAVLDKKQFAFQQQKKKLMKKMIFMAALLLASVASFAQHRVGSVTIQPKVGLNIASITEGDDSSPRYGLAAGAEFEYQATELFSLSAGLIYSMQGACEEESGTKYTAKLDYINIPILANVYVVKGLAVKLGVQPALNVNNKLKADYDGFTSEVSLDKAGVDFKSFDFSIPVGLSYEYQNVVFDARYNFGLTKLVDGDDSKNSVFQFTIGYKFDL